MHGCIILYRLLGGLGLNLFNSFSFLFKHLVSLCLRRWLILELFSFWEE